MRRTPPSFRKKTAALSALALLITVFIVWPFLYPVAGGGKKTARSFQSKTITKRTPGHSVNVDLDITGVKRLYLIVLDGGNGYGCDWADWAEPRLVGPEGEKKLTDLKWNSAKSSWGKVRVNRNAAGGAMRIAGKPVDYGIGTHANSIIVFDLPKGYTRFNARGGLDNGGTDQAGGGGTSVQFMVFADKLPRRIAKLARSGGGGNRAGGQSPAEALAALDVADGLEVKLFASEPMMLSPSNIDVDDKGRVWVCEVVNYRRRNGQRKEGDRILILEDTDGDNKADKSTVFYQGRDIDSAHGICVLPTPSGKNTKVIVSVGSGVYIFNDADGDGKADGRKTTMFSGISGTQHDHGIHAFVFGPDGKLYFNFGNSGRQIRDANGKQIVDMAGKVVAAHRNPYQEGMVFRCDMDGSNFETLGWNFRNNWEVSVDSFGTIWQSDNDDDGNRGVRINYVMEFGNYGYRDEFTGAGWKSSRTGMHAEIPKRHWHLNDPGVVPNLLQTGAGSPTGIIVYEGALLPKLFQNQVIHCDAGPNIVRAYPAVKDGAGYSAKMVDIVHGARDKWFRPSDVCVAPDGSLIIADWYDPGVGGHGMGDTDRGRLFRVAPPKSAYKTPRYDYSTPDGAAKALCNPNHTIRYLAWTALNKMQGMAEPALLKLFAKDQPAVLRARALWLLAKIKGKGKHYVDRAIADANSDIRIVGLRIARQHKLDVIGYAEKLCADKSPQVRREVAIALRHSKSEEVPHIWTHLAEKHDGKDRWYLEALGIAAEGRWDQCLESWLEHGGSCETPAGRDIVWRSRAKKTPELLAKIIANPKIGRYQLPRYFRAFDFQKRAKEDLMIALAFGDPKGDADRKNLIAAEAIARLKNFDVNHNPKHKKALNRVLQRSKGTSQFVSLVKRFSLRDHYPGLLQLALKNPTAQVGVDAIAALLDNQEMKLIRTAVNSKDVKNTALPAVQALGTSRHNRVYGLLMPLITNAKRDLELRRQAVRALAGIRRGAQDLVQMASAKQLDAKLKESAGAALHQAQWRDVKAAAFKLFPLPAAKNKKPLPPITSLVAHRGDAARGMKIFRTAAKCANCHIVGKFGKEVGPNLSEIGDKLSKQAFFESILFPSAAISHNYENYTVVLKNGNVVNGLLISQTPEKVAVKSDDAIVRTFPRKEIALLNRLPISLMPADAAKEMTVQDLVDVVAYMETLTKKKK